MRMKRAQQMLNTIIGAFTGVFLGHGAFVLWDHRAHPELYAANSAPWYASILLYGACTLAVVAVCLLIKAALRRREEN